MFKHRIALAVSAVALIASVGGTAVAAKLLTGKDIKNNSLTGADIKNRSVAKKDLRKAVLASLKGPKGDTGAQGLQGPQGPPGTPDGYTKAEADAAFLGKTAKAADADKLDGADGDDLVAGDAALVWGALNRNGNTAEVTLVSLGNMGSLRVQCLAGGSKNVSIANASGAAISFNRTVVTEGANPDLHADTVADGDTDVIAGETADFQMTVQVHRAGANPLAAEDFSTVTLYATDDGADCHFRGQAINNERDAANLVINP